MTAIANISEDAWQRAQKEGASFAGASPPVSLDQLAASWKIRRIRFEPLLSDAGLAMTGDDLEIVFNTESFGVSQKTGDVIATGTNGLDALPPALRFTMAHEVAHAIFLDLAGGDSRLDLFQKNSQAVENACNILARVLLLPKQMLVREIRNRLFDVDHVQKVLSSFRVSPEVFIRRIGLYDMRGEWKDIDGFLAFAQEIDGVIRIRACHITGSKAVERFERAFRSGNRHRELPHRSLSDSYRHAEWTVEDQPISKLSLGIDVESLLRNNEAGQRHLEVLWRSDSKETVPCELMYYRVHKQPLGFLVGIRMTDPKHQVVQKTLV